MHFRTLATVKILEVQEDKEIDRQIKEDLKELQMKKEAGEEGIVLDILIERCQGLRSAFSRAVDSHISEVMYPYFVGIEDPQYMEFIDRTAQLREEFKEGVDCIKLPEGRIVEWYSNPIYNSFTIRDGKVFQRGAGPLHQEKRTKSAKRMKALLNYPREKLYKDFREYAENACGMIFDEEHQGYGFYYNPNGMWDWYSIGGRWPDMFLVQETCTEYSIGERSWCNMDKTFEAPEGYIWVCAARKKDIAWDVMRDWENQKATRAFDRLEKMFMSGKIEDNFRGEIVEDGILQWDMYIYHKGDLLETYLEEYGIPKDWKYPIGVHDIVDADEWQAKDDKIYDSETGTYIPVDWRKCLDEYIDALDEDAVLVGVDYHI